MTPKYVKPYVKRGKNDAVDAEAICEAVTCPTMRFVAVKSVDQQSDIRKTSTSSKSSPTRNRLFKCFQWVPSMSGPTEQGRYSPSTILAMMLCWISFEPA